MRTSKFREWSNEEIGRHIIGLECHMVSHIFIDDEGLKEIDSFVKDVEEAQVELAYRVKMEEKQKGWDNVDLSKIRKQNRES